MRISDWSSDVCSSDLAVEAVAVWQGAGAVDRRLRGRLGIAIDGIEGNRFDRFVDEPDPIGEEIVAIFGGDRHTEAGAPRPAAPFIADAAVELELAELHRVEQIDSIIVDFAALAAGVGERSEEHTSELQSLMRISYAVFCLKKKNNIQ